MSGAKHYCPSKVERLDVRYFMQGVPQEIFRLQDPALFAHPCPRLLDVLGYLRELKVSKDDLHNIAVQATSKAPVSPMCFLRSYWAASAKVKKTTEVSYPYVKEFSWNLNRDGLNLVVNGPKNGPKLIKLFLDACRDRGVPNPYVVGPQYTDESISLIDKIALEIPGRPFSPRLLADAFTSDPCDIALQDTHPCKRFSCAADGIADILKEREKLIDLSSIELNTPKE